MRDPLLVPDFREFLHAGETAALKEFFADHHPARVAEVIEDLEPAEGDAILNLLEPRVRGEVLSYIASDLQVQIVEAMPPAGAADLLHFMPHDDRADLVNRLDEDKADAILRRLAQAEREDIRRLTSYEPGTAGAVMTTDYATLPPFVSVREALDRLVHEAPDRETINVNYVVDAHRHLLGSIALPKLVLARRTARVEDIMQADPITARVDEDQEEVARKIAKYDLIAIPVLDHDGMLVGIVTHDDALDILRQEQTEDLLAFGAVSPEAGVDDTPYWQGKITTAVRRRIVWLLLLFAAGTITGLVVRTFSWIDERFPHINFDAFIPLLIGTGGNAGSQTVGTVIRGLALGEIQLGDTLRVLFREWLTGSLLGALLGTLGFLYTWGLLRHEPLFGMVIALAILGICMWANVVGALVPMVAHRLHIDPAVVSAPLISTLVDATGLVIFYSIAIALLIKLGG